jgi:glycosyltransferase involved in cell wall biosynthesis
MAETKRLLLVVTQAEWGGVQGYVFRCAREALRRDWEVLVAAGGEGLLETHCHAASIPYRRLREMLRHISPLDDFRATRELIGLMKAWRPDTVYLHSSKAGIVGSIAARRAKAPRVVYRIGGWSFLDPVSSFQIRIRLWSEKLTARYKHLIITVHPGDEACAKKHHIRAREAVITIPNGLDPLAFNASLQSREVARHVLSALFASPLPEQTRILLSIAHFYPTKDLIGYLHALARVARDLPSIRAVILGDGEQREALEALRVRLGLQDNVSLPGARPDAATLLAGADLFVLSSAKEGMPWTVLEAMAANTPIVTTDVGSNAWVLHGDAGWIVPPRDPDALAAAITEALCHPEEARLRAARARTALETRFAEQDMWESTFHALEPIHTADLALQTR